MIINATVEAGCCSNGENGAFSFEARNPKQPDSINSMFAVSCLPALLYVFIYNVILTGMWDTRLGKKLYRSMVKARRIESAYEKVSCQRCSRASVRGGKGEGGAIGGGGAQGGWGGAASRVATRGAVQRWAKQCPQPLTNWYPFIKGGNL